MTSALEHRVDVLTHLVLLLVDHYAEHNHPEPDSSGDYSNDPLQYGDELYSFRHEHFS